MRIEVCAFNFHLFKSNALQMHVWSHVPSWASAVKTWYNKLELQTQHKGKKEGMLGTITCIIHVLYSFWGASHELEITNTSLSL